MKNSFKVALVALLATGQVYTSQLQLAYKAGMGAMELAQAAEAGGAVFSKAMMGYFRDERTGKEHSWRVTDNDEISVDVRAQYKEMLVPGNIRESIIAGLKRQNIQEDSLKTTALVVSDSKKMLDQATQAYLRRDQDFSYELLRQQAQDWEGLFSWPVDPETQAEAMYRAMQEHYDSFGDIDYTKVHAVAPQVDVMKGNAALHVINGQDGKCGDFPEVREAIEQAKRANQEEADYLKAELYDKNLDPEFVQELIAIIDTQREELERIEAQLTQDQQENQDWEGCWDWSKDNSFDWKQFAKDNKEPIVAAGLIAAGGAGLYLGEKKLQKEAAEA